MRNLHLFAALGAALALGAAAGCAAPSLAPSATVNWVAGSQRPADVTGVGASPIDHFFSAVGSNLGSDFKPGKLTRPTVVDHR